MMHCSYSVDINDKVLWFNCVIAVWSNFKSLVLKAIFYHIELHIHVLHICICSKILSLFELEWLELEVVQSWSLKEQTI